MTYEVLGGLLHTKLQPIVIQAEQGRVPKSSTDLALRLYMSSKVKRDLLEPAQKVYSYQISSSNERVSCAVIGNDAKCETPDCDVKYKFP
jgi:hypothetical protein